MIIQGTYVRFIYTECMIYRLGDFRMRSQWASNTLNDFLVTIRGDRKIDPRDLCGRSPMVMRNPRLISFCSSCSSATETMNRRHGDAPYKFAVFYIHLVKTIPVSYGTATRKTRSRGGGKRLVITGAECRENKGDRSRLFDTEAFKEKSIFEIN